VRKPLLWLAIPYLFWLAGSGLLGPDEPRYTAIGLSMADSGDWITPRLWGSPWFEKPPLNYWLVASFRQLGFAPDWAARLPVALLGFCFLFALPTLEAGIVLGTSLGFLSLSQVGITDAPLTICFNAWLLLLLRGRTRWAGFFLGLAVLAKGLVPLVLCLPVALLYRKQWQWLITMLLTATPWYLACYAANGQIFFDDFIWKHHVLRFLSPELQHVQPFWFYLPVLAGFCLPWTPVLAAIRPNEANRPYWYTFLWGLFFLSVSKNKLPAYILPVLPSLAILAAPHLKRWHWAFAAAVFVALPSVSPWVPTALEDGLSKAPFSSTAWAWLAASPLAAWVIYRWQRRELFLAIFALSILTLKLTLYPALAETMSVRNRYEREKPACYPAEASRSYRYGLFYYAGRELPICLELQKDLPLLQSPDQSPGNQQIQPGNDKNPPQR
jgi:4-amino-4-deoxy-L-arabinose transferase-like glycosyltransferase